VLIGLASRVLASLATIRERVSVGLEVLPSLHFSLYFSSFTSTPIHESVL
jgi:hypothetical protein